MSILTREDILACDDLQRERVEVPEWSRNGEARYIFVRVLTGAEIETLQSRAAGKDLSPTQIALLSICDERGSRLFTDAELPVLGKKSQRALMRIVEAALRVNGLDEKGREELEGN